MESGYLPNGCGLIARERVRQEQQLGWTPEHDDHHTDGELCDAAICYASACEGEFRDAEGWPFEEAAFKPSENPVENLIKAGALIAAEIDRRRRKFKAACNAISVQDFGFEVFDEMDAYSLEGSAWIGVDPQAFLSEHFEEDYERLKYQEGQRREYEEEGDKDAED